jgi:CHAT domain-containing protein
VEGELDDAKQQWRNALSDGGTSQNLALQADVLVAMSGFSQVAGNLPEALDLANRASDLARKGKSLYLQARALGELGHLQLAAGKNAEARASIEEALRIDRFNKYDWEAGHLLYLAWVTAAESDSNLDKAIQIALSARTLAITKENYLIFMQASTFLGQAYVHEGQVITGIQMLERAQDGRSDDGKELFKRPASYQAAVALPFGRVIFLEALAMAYQAGQRSDEGLKTWQQLYDTGKAAGFTLATAEAAHAIAGLYGTKKEYDKAIYYYSLAAQAWALGGNEQRRIEALASEGSLLVQNGQKDRALQVDEVLLPLAKAANNSGLQFIVDVSIAEILDGTEKLDRVDSALRDAESLVTPDVKVAGVQPGLIVEFYIRLAQSSERRKDRRQELVALEKALTPAVVLANAPGDTKNAKPAAWLVGQLEAKIADYRIRDAGETAYGSGNFGDALVFLELLQYFEEFDAAWKGQLEQYTKNLSSDPTLTRLVQLPNKIISEDDGAAILAKNIEDMGPIAYRVELASLGLLTSYYMLHQRPDMIVKFARQALPSLKLGENDTPSSWDVAMSCELAYALMLEKDLAAAVEALMPCMASAKKLGNVELLQQAHQTNVWVLEAAGKRAQAQESIQFLLKQKPDDPLEYVQLALLKTQQGDRLAAADAWRKAIQLYGVHNNLSGAANAHIALADLLTSGDGADPDERRTHLEAADALYRQLGSSEGRVKAEASLGIYFAAQKDVTKAHQYLESALKTAREVKRQDLEASVLSQIGQAYESSGDSDTAKEYYAQSATIYHQLKNPADESIQLMNLARGLYVVHQPEEALKKLLRAEALADTSDSWIARYWIRRSIADIYQTKGQYQSCLSALREAKQISDAAKQPLFSAWVSLAMAGYLQVIGDWQEASEQATLALPVLHQFNDTDDESVAYVELMAIYGARESELKDLNKALEFYQKAYQLIVTTHPERAASLNLDVAEIYWNQGKFKDAIAKANEALEYYKRLKDELNEANALISLSEGQRSGGDLQTAADSLRLAEPLVMRAKNFYTTGRLYYGQAALLRKQGRFKEAVDKYLQVVGMLEQFKSTSNTANRRLVSETYSFIYDELIDTYYSLGIADKQDAPLSAEKALEYTELNKSRVFANSWGLAFMDGLKRQVPAQLQEKERLLLAQQAALQSELQESLAGAAAHRPAAEIEHALDAVNGEQSEFKQRLRQASPAYAEARYPQAVTLAQIPVHADELLIEFKMLKDSVLVWMVGSSAEQAHLIAFYKVDRSREWFEKRILSLRDAFNTGHPEEFDPKICEELFNNLFPEPFAGHLKDARSVVFIPDDILFLLPLEMLSPTASKGQFVLLKTATEYFPSAAVFRLSRAAVRTRPAWQEQFIGIADPITSPSDERYVAAAILVTPKPDKTASIQQDIPAVRGVSINTLRSRNFALERLPGTAIEVKSIADLFSEGAGTVEVRTGMDATKQELMQTDLGRFRFVHFATHGVLPVEAGIKEPALILSYDGISLDDMLLTLSEVFQLQLHADMVVLSACNTGSGKVTRAEGVASLGTAFLAAGASSVTVSLWHVADNSTAILMQEFYRNLLKGMPKAASLAAARSTLVSQGYDNPFFWAPFVLTGE